MTKPKANSDQPSSRRRGTSPPTKAASDEGVDLLTTLLRGIVVMLLVARWLLPTESAAEGETLWLSQLTLGAGLIWIWSVFRGSLEGIRFGWIDACVAVLVLGHIVSGVYLLAVGGEKRAAINMMWEWVSLGVLFFLMRQIFFGPRDARRILTVLLTTTTVLAGLGVWQHYVFYPQATREYDAQKSELERLRKEILSAAPQQARNLQARIQEIESNFFAQGIPLEGPAQQLYEQRLRASTEPFGLFALANSYAGLLLPGLFVGLTSLAGVRAGNSGRGSMVMIAFVVTLIGFALLLTKSRTAWVGLAVGLSSWGLAAFLRGSTERTSRRVFGIVGSLVGLGVIVGGAILSGALDAAVLTEAPKSLQYRLQYWRGAAGVLRESPFFGTGPGNFRQNYLKHKLPESSEEIADPHNLLLDVWSNGGLIALVGLCGFLVTAATAARRRPSVDSEESQPRHQPPAARGGKNTDNSSSVFSIRSGREIYLGAAAAFPLILAADLLTGNAMDLRLVVLWITWCILNPLLVRMLTSGKIAESRRSDPISALAKLSNSCLLGALVAITVHLLGAGGMEMPAIVQIFFLLAVCIFSIRDSSLTPSNHQSRAGFLVAGSLIAGSFAACFYTAAIPHIRCNGLMAAGDSVVASGGLDGAGRYYQEAAAADPFAPEPLEKLAELTFSRWQQAQSPSQELFDDAVQISRLSIGSNPNEPHGYWHLGEWYLKKFDRSKDHQDAVSAIEELSRAVDRYPHSPRLRALRAVAYVRAENREEARMEAGVALELHKINRLEGHNDKCLPTRAELAKRGTTNASLEPTVEEIRQIAGEPTTP